MSLNENKWNVMEMVQLRIELIFCVHIEYKQERGLKLL